MNRGTSSEIERVLLSVLLILTSLASGYLIKGTISRVLADDEPPAADSKPVAKGTPGTSAYEVEAAHLVNSKVTKESLVEAPHQGPVLGDIGGAPFTPKPSGSPGPNTRFEAVDFQATAYCLKGRTASGIGTRPGVIAADTRILPLGTVVHVTAGRYTGTYTVLDTGGRIKGRSIDIYLPDYLAAKRFGRQRVKVRVLSKPSSRPAPARFAREALSSVARSEGD